MTRAVKHELKKAKRYRETLLLFKEALRDGDSTILELSEGEFGYGWIEAAKRQRISEVYWPIVDLPEFNMESVPEW